ncbi:MAG: ATPase [Sedimenticola sp.]|nr:MAG: ATPase [Sedimenticola sp.]
MVDQVYDLESAILARANRLATEYRERAKRSRDNILRDAHERLHLREEREVLLAKAKAERTYRRRVQANELRFHKEMDHLRWSLVQSVQERLADKIQQFTKDEASYLAFLKRLLHTSARQFERNTLIAEVNHRDLKILTPIWETVAKEAAPDKTISLYSAPLESLGGILLHSEDNRVRLNNTFEGRLERLNEQLNRVIVERLMPTGPESGTLFIG